MIAFMIMYIYLFILNNIFEIFSFKFAIRLSKNMKERKKEKKRKKRKLSIICHWNFFSSFFFRAAFLFARRIYQIHLSQLQKKTINRDIKHISKYENSLLVIFFVSLSAHFFILLTGTCKQCV